MSEILLSPLAIYNAQAAANEPTFLDAEYFAIPTKLTAEDREALSALILSETAELEVVYPEPSTLCAVVKAWSHARLPAWERVLSALTEKYNPVHNYDRYEDEHGTDTGTRTETDTGTRTETDTGSRTETENEDISDTADDTTTGQTTGFNSGTFADDKKTISAGSGSRDRDLTRGETRDLSRGETRNLSRGETRNLANSRTLHAYGNIGVTTAEAMIVEELQLRKTDMLRIITDEFTRYFCLCIY